jgi:hypothetical protein
VGSVLFGDSNAYSMKNATPFVPKYKASRISQKSNPTNFDQIFRKINIYNIEKTHRENILYGNSSDTDLVLWIFIFLCIKLF